MISIRETVREAVQEIREWRAAAAESAVMLRAIRAEHAAGKTGTLDRVLSGKPVSQQAYDRADREDRMAAARELWEAGHPVQSAEVLHELVRSGVADREGSA